MKRVDVYEVSTKVKSVVGDYVQFYSTHRPDLASWSDVHGPKDEVVMHSAPVTCFRRCDGGLVSDVYVAIGPEIERPAPSASSKFGNFGKVWMAVDPAPSGFVSSIGVFHNYSNPSSVNKVYGK